MEPSLVKQKVNGVYQASPNATIQRKLCESSAIVRQRWRTRGASQAQTGCSDSRGQRLVAHAAPDAQRLHCFEHVVDADDLRPLLDGFRGKGDASTEAPIGRRLA